MRCPRCNEENPEGRGFCIKCAYPLPETPQQNQQPPVEPIRFEQPTPNYYPQNVQGNPYPNPAPVVRKRPVGLGIASLILGISALTAALWAILWAALPFNQYMSDYESYYSGSTAAQLPQGTVTTIFVIVYAFFCDPDGNPRPDFRNQSAWALPQRAEPLHGETDVSCRCDYFCCRIGLQLYCTDRQHCNNILMRVKYIFLLTKARNMLQYLRICKCDAEKRTASGA